MIVNAKFRTYAISAVLPDCSLNARDLLCSVRYEPTWHARAIDAGVELATDTYVRLRGVKFREYGRRAVDRRLMAQTDRGILKSDEQICRRSTSQSDHRYET